jgi:aldose 1-epimerase
MGIFSAFLNDLIMNSNPLKLLPKVQKEFFGTLSSGVEVFNYTLINSNGSKVSVLNYGAIIQNLLVSDSVGNYENIVLNYDNLEAYTKDTFFIGATIGRYANRINDAKFTLDGHLYELDANDGSNSLHGGFGGFNKVVWTAKTSTNNSSASVSLSYHSSDMENGFPGNLFTTITYTLTNSNSLEIYYTSTTDKKTVVNLTNHSYFNLSGNFRKTVLDHHLKIESDYTLEVNSNLIPSAKFDKVTSTPFDFRQPKLIGQHITSGNNQLRLGSGYDHCWVLNSEGNLQSVSKIVHETTGRTLEVFTTEPGIHIYTGNHLKGLYNKHSGVCLETQHFPNSPNEPGFPTVILSPEDTYRSTTIFKFSNQ